VALGFQIELEFGNGKRVLSRNDTAHDEFAEAVRAALEGGRGNYRNILIKGASNCVKTSLLNLLNTVYFLKRLVTQFARRRNRSDFSQ